MLVKEVGVHPASLAQVDYEAEGFKTNNGEFLSFCIVGPLSFDYLRFYLKILKYAEWSS